MVDWETKSNKLSGKSLSDCEGQTLIDIVNEQCAEQLVLFPTRNENTLDLIITTSPNQYSNISSQDSFSDHEIISSSLNHHSPPIKQPKRKYFQYSKEDFTSMRKDTNAFSTDKYFNGHQNNRDVNQNWNMIKNFINDSADKYIPSKTSANKKTFTMDN